MESLFLSAFLSGSVFLSVCLCVSVNRHVELQPSIIATSQTKITADNDSTILPVSELLPVLAQHHCCKSMCLLGSNHPSIKLMTTLHIVFLTGWTIWSSSWRTKMPSSAISQIWHRLELPRVPNWFIFFIKTSWFFFLWEFSSGETNPERSTTACWRSRSPGQLVDLITLPVCGWLLIRSVKFMSSFFCVCFVFRDQFEHETWLWQAAWSTFRCGKDTCDLCLTLERFRASHFTDRITYRLSIKLIRNLEFHAIKLKARGWCQPPWLGLGESWQATSQKKALRCLDGSFLSNSRKF